MCLGDLAGMVAELSGNKAGRKLQLIKDLSTEGVVLAVAGDIFTACSKLNYGVVVIGIFKVGYELVTLRGNYSLFGKLIFRIGIIDGVYNGFCGDNFAFVYCNRVFCCSCFTKRRSRFSRPPSGRLEICKTIQEV